MRSRALIIHICTPIIQSLENVDGKRLYNEAFFFHVQCNYKVEDKLLASQKYI